jgi:hypothetical protein
MFGLTKNEKLRKAAKDNNPQAVIKWLDEGAKINASDVDDFTALHLASVRGHVEVVKILIERGADLNIKNHAHNSALYCAVTEGHLDVVKLLVEKGVDLNIKNFTGKSALIKAAYCDHTEIAMFLIEAGAEIDLKDEGGNTALIWAVHKGHRKSVELLIEKGADVNIRDRSDKNAYDYARRKNYHEIENIIAAKMPSPPFPSPSPETIETLTKKILREKIFFPVIHEVINPDAEEKDKFIYTPERYISRDRRLVEVFNFETRTKTFFVQADKILGAPTETYFDSMPNQVDVLRPIWEAYHAKGGTISEDSIYPEGRQKVKLSTIGVTLKN